LASEWSSNGEYAAFKGRSLLDDSRNLTVDLFFRSAKGFAFEAICEVRSQQLKGIVQLSESGDLDPPKRDVAQCESRLRQVIDAHRIQ
jgi:hypothetical protein